MNLSRDFDTMMYGRNDDAAGIEHRLHLTDFAFLEALPKRRRPFLAKMRSGLRALPQISKIRIHIIFQIRESITR